VPCEECAGSGFSHCCDGLQEQPMTTPPNGLRR
jgi:hypothetical protein